MPPRLCVRERDDDVRERSVSVRGCHARNARRLLQVYERERDAELTPARATRPDRVRALPGVDELRRPRVPENGSGGETRTRRRDPEKRRDRLRRLPKGYAVVATPIGGSRSLLAAL
jgi:hypothetical protein